MQGMSFSINTIKIYKTNWGLNSMLELGQEDITLSPLNSYKYYKFSTFFGMLFHNACEIQSKVVTPVPVVFCTPGLFYDIKISSSLPEVQTHKSSRKQFTAIHEFYIQNVKSC